MNQAPSQYSQQPQYVQCPRCGAWNYPNVPQCHHCGLPFTAQPVQYQQKQYYQQAQQQLKPTKQWNPAIKTFLGCFGAFVFFLVIVFIVLAITSDSKKNGNVVSVSTATAQSWVSDASSQSAPEIAAQEQEQEQEPNDSTPPEIYGKFDIVVLLDRSITLNEATASGGVLKAVFTIENYSQKTINVSSLLEWSARNSDGENLEINLFDCNGPSLDGAILPNDKLKGEICYTISGSPPFRIYYNHDFISSHILVWQVQ